MVIHKYLNSCITGNLVVVKQLVHEVGVNYQDDNKTTGLNWAVWKGHNNVVKYLLSMPGIDVNIVNHKGWSPLHSAVFRKNRCIIHYYNDA